VHCPVGAIPTLTLLQNKFLIYKIIKVIYILLIKFLLPKNKLSISSFV
jgi:hypothetical protein